MTEPSQRPRRHWWWHCRRVLRYVRWCTWLLALIVVGVLVYFYNRDLPDSFKQKLQAKLYERGMDVQIEHLRWRWYQGFVALGVKFGAAKTELISPRFSVQEVVLKLHAGAIRHFKLNDVDSLILKDGKFSWIVSEPGEPSEALVFTNIQAEVRLLPNDNLQLSHFTTTFGGATLQLTGSVTNASAMRDWKMFQPKPGAQPGVLREHLRRFIRTANTIQFEKQPQLNVLIHGDALNPQSFSTEFSLEATAADTPWGKLGHGQLNARLTPSAASNGQSQLDFKLRAEDADTRWGGARELNVELHAAGDQTGTNLISAQLEIAASGTDTPWIAATNAHFSAQWTHSLTNPVPAAGKVELVLTDTRSHWATADEVRLDGTLSTATNVPRADASWGWWANLEACVLDWNCKFEEIRAEDFESKELACSGRWRAPELTLTNLHSEMYRGTLRGSAGLNVASRLAHFEGSSDFDLQKAYPFLTPGGREWIQSQAFAWETPPVVRAGGSVVLAPWTNRAPDWRGMVLPTLVLQGDFLVGKGSFREIPVNSAMSHFFYSNRVWNLPDLAIVRPEGGARVEVHADNVSSNFYFHIHSDMDIKAARSLLDTNAQKALDFLQLSRPPIIDVELSGRFHDYDSIGAKGHLAVTNIIFRGESASALACSFAYTNKFVLVTDARVDRPEGYATASAVGVDIPGKRAYLTNAVNHDMEPMAFVRTLGPKIASFIEPYHFPSPPKVQVNGVIPLSDDISMADLHFNIEGGPFEWLLDTNCVFHSQHVAGIIDWVGETMKVDVTQAEFYGGSVVGTANFNFKRDIGADYTMDITVSDTSLHRLITDVMMETNKVEGSLSGHLVLTDANTQFKEDSWEGNGWVELKDGVIWEIPIFGALTPVLNNISPGLGESRAREARADFTINKSVAHTDDLEIHSPVMRILYRGSVGLFGDRKVDATASAEIGRDMPWLGPVLGTMLVPFTKPFDFKITGTLKKPKYEIKNEITRGIMMPFTVPWHMLKDLFPSESNPATNAPPPAVPPLQ